MSAASTNLDDDGDSTTSSDGGGYIGVPVGQKEFPGQPHVGGKTIVGGGKTLVGGKTFGKTFKSMGETSTDNDSDDEEEPVLEEDNEDEEGELEVEEDPSDDEETEDEDDTFPLRKFPPTKVHKTKVSASATIKDEPQSQLEAWKEVHASLTKAVLVAREAIAAKKLQRRFWLETICGNLSHPSEVKATTLPGVAPSNGPPSQMPLLLSHSVWFKPDQRKKKRGSKKQPVASEEKPKKPRKKKATSAATVHNKTTLASLTKKKPAKGASTIKKRKQQTLPKKKRVTASLPTSKSKANVSLSVDKSKVLPPETKAAASVLSVFADDSDEDSNESAVAMAVEANEDDESEDVIVAEEEDEDDSKSGFQLYTFDADDSSSEDEDADGDKKMTPANDEIEPENDTNEDNSSDNDGPDWNASQQSHPFLKKRRSSINSTTQRNLDSSEIYSTFRAGSEENEEVKQDEGEQDQETPSSRMMGTMSGYGAFGESDSSEDEIPF